MLTCSQCKKIYHLNCTNISEKLFQLMRQKNSNAWKCEKCQIRTRKQSIPSSSTMDPSKITSTPQEFVTQRPRHKINIPTDNSFESLHSENTDYEECSALEASILNRSCPEAAYSIREEFDDLKLKISSLENKLQIAEKEIENLSIENTSLKKQIINYEKKTSQLTHICRSTPTIDRNKKERKSLNKTKLNFNRLDRTNNEQKSQKSGFNDTNTTEIHEESKSELKTGHNNDVHEDIIVAETAESTIEMNNKDENIIPKKKVVIFSDQNGKGIRNILQNIIGNSYEVTAIVKPNAHIDQVLSSCNNICKEFTKSDFVIILAGSNDRNPFHFQSFLHYYLTLLAHTNVIIGEIYENKALNVFKQNEIIRLVCSQLSNSTFVPFQYYDLGRYQKLHSGRLILREILAVNYKHNYTNHIQKTYNNTQRKHKTPVQTVITQYFKANQSNTVAEKSKPKFSKQDDGSENLEKENKEDETQFFRDQLSNF